MIRAYESLKAWFFSWFVAWDRFWFTPSDPQTLGLIRITGGAMLFYTHLVWGKDFAAFLGPDGWLPNELMRDFFRGSSAWSYLWYFESTTVLWVLHLIALVIFAFLTVGLFSRVVPILAWLITIAYCQRLNGAFYGLDQVNGMLAMYLALGRSGDAYSLDRWWQQRRGLSGPPPASIRTNLAIRMIQLHLCIIYVFGGISKLRGEMWWDGSAVWFSVANLEYQTLDMTWLVQWPWLIALMTHTTVFWETFYCALVWPKITRPLALFLAVCVHGGIVVFLGMPTFGLAMIIANGAFLSPQWVDTVIHSLLSPFGLGGAGRGRGETVPTDVAPAV